MYCRILGVMVVMLAHSISWSQLPEFKARFGRERQSTARQPSGLEILENGPQGIYVLRSKLEGDPAVQVPWSLESYDQSTLALKKSSYLNLKGDGKRTRTEGVVQLNGKLYIIYSATDDRKRTTRLTINTVDRTTLKPELKGTDICEIQHRDLTRIRDTRFRIELSNDHSKILCFKELTTNGAGKNLYSFVMFDSTFHVMWQKEFVLPYAAGQFNPTCARVGNDGNAYVLGVVRSGLGLNRVYDLLLIQNKGETILRYPQRMPSGFLSSVQIQIRGNDLYCSGFYSKLGGVKACGVYFSMVDLTSRRVKNHCHSEFDLKFILQNLSKYDMRWAMVRANEGEATELYSYNVNNLLVQEDGSAILIAEQYYKYSSPNLEYRMTGATPTRASKLLSSRTFYYSVPRNYHGHILVIKVDSLGQIQWARKIEKAQDTSAKNGVFASCLVANIRGKLCLVFNIDPRNLDDGKEREFSSLHSMVVVVSVSMDGNQVRQFLYESAEKSVPVRPGMSGQTSDDEIILFGRKGHTEQFTRLQFK
jgi:hypothetical protein